MKRFIALTGMVVMFAFSAGPGFAVPIHEHWLSIPTGDEIHVGPTACGASTDSGIYTGWLNFHENVHVGVPGNQAFDIDSNPVDISATHC